MRNRLSLLIGLIAVGVLAAGLGSPAKAAEGKFEGVIAAPTPAPGTEYADLACGDPAGGPLNGVNYAWIDLEADYTKFDLTGPMRLFEDPAGGTGIGDYDFDLYLYDAKCTDITTHTNGPEAFVKTSTKRPARFAMIIYWTGIYPAQPYVLQASN